MLHWHGFALAELLDQCHCLLVMASCGIKARTWIGACQTNAASHSKTVQFAMLLSASMVCVCCSSAQRGSVCGTGNGGYGRLGHVKQQDEFKPRNVETFSQRVPVAPNMVRTPPRPLLHAPSMLLPLLMSLPSQACLCSVFLLSMLDPRGVPKWLTHGDMSTRYSCWNALVTLTSTAMRNDHHLCILYPVPPERSPCMWTACTVLQSVYRDASTPTPVPHSAAGHW